MNAAPELPSFGVVTAALRCTTEHLARELASPSAAAPDWSDFEWTVARAVAAMQGISVLLANRLTWRGPPAWQEFLDTQCRRARQREVRISTLLEKLDGALRTAGVCAVGLKGTALRRLGLYAAGERPMGDIDLLVAPDELPRLQHALHTLDYHLLFDARRHRVFAPRDPAVASECGEHPDNPLKIEVHHSIGEMLPVRKVDITRCVLPREPRPGIQAYPATADLFRHLLLHAAGNMRAHALRLLQLHDLARLATRLDAAAWETLHDTPEECGGTWWMWPVLAVTQRYLPGRLPAAARGLRAHCPWLLRTTAERMSLTEVSWSNLHIAALPGLCWSRSPGDVLRFARSRVLPERVALDELESLKVSMPSALRQPWYGLPHAHRIARWLFSRPPRVQTLMSLRAALHGPR